MKILFFAKLREQLEVSELQLDIPSQAKTVTDVIDLLVLQLGEGSRALLEDPQIICALDHEKVDKNTSLGHCHELAFFPPVTGG